MKKVVVLRVLALRGVEDFLDDDRFYCTCAVGDDYLEASTPLPASEWMQEPFALPLAATGALCIYHLSQLHPHAHCLAHRQAHPRLLGVVEADEAHSVGAAPKSVEWVEPPAPWPTSNPCGYLCSAAPSPSC
jgi:hypothetical protein